MFNRLNGWQRIGVVLTALWLLFALAIGAASLASPDEVRGPFVLHVDAKTKIVPGTPAQCTKPAPPPDPTRKVVTFEEAFYGCAPGAMIEGTPDQTIQLSPAHDYFRYFTFLAFALTPPFAFWLIAYLTIFVFRWVASGFRRNST